MEIVQFLRDISSELNIPKSTVAFVIKKWKVKGDCRNVVRTGRPTKLRDRDRRVLSKEIRKNFTNGLTPGVLTVIRDCCFCNYHPQGSTLAWCTWSCCHP
ncbi:transposable element Tc1 transposase [Trichonephila clavipes]|nr:transposable element Tc1 transposase [Trichonephila clavipes]